MEFSSVDDDEVLDPAADEQLSIGHVSEVARVQPTVAKCLDGRFLVAKVAVHHGRSGQHNLADGPLGYLPSVSVDDPQPVCRQRCTATDDAHPVARFTRNRRGTDGEILGRQPVHTNRAPAPGQRGCHDVLRKAIAWNEARRSKAGSGKPFRECLERPGMDRLAAAPRHAPVRQVHALEVTCLDAAHAQVVGEVGSEADRAAMA